MNFLTFKNFQGTLSHLAKGVLTPKALPANGSRGIHQICSRHSSMLNTTSNQNPLKAANLLSSILQPNSFLTPVSPQFNQVCGLRVKGHLLLKCKSCYKVSIDGLLYVMCKTHPSHKQKKKCDWPTIKLKAKQRYIN